MRDFIGQMEHALVEARLDFPFRDAFKDGYIAAVADANEYFAKIVLKNQKQAEALRVARDVLRELGHYGIDFGYGVYDCNVAEVAQKAQKQIEQILGEGE